MAAAAEEGAEVEVERRPPAEAEAGERFRMAAVAAAAVAGCRMRGEVAAAVAEARRRKRLVVGRTLSCSPCLGRLGRRAEGVHPRTCLLPAAVEEGGEEGEEARRVATTAPQRPAR